MTWNDPPPNAWNEESEPSPTPDLSRQVERLREIERQLQSAQPAPPSLNEAAWERIIAASQAPAATPSETATRVRPQRRRWLGLASGAIAAIWLSGVVVGSSVMFFVMDHEPEIAAKNPRQPSVTMAPEAVDREADAPEAIDFESVASKRTEPENGESWQSPNPRGKHRLSGPMLVSQSPLRPFGHTGLEAPMFIVSLTDSPNPPSRDQVRLEQSESQRRLASTFVPPPKTTPQRVLEDLMSDGTTTGQPL